MRFEKIQPAEFLKPYIKYYVISEAMLESQYKVFPTTGLVIGFQYSGRLSAIEEKDETSLATSGITGLSDHYKVFRNSANIGTILVYFTETGFAHFSTNPVNELFNQSISLDLLFDKNKISETEEKLAIVKTDKQRIRVVEQFFLSQLRDIQKDKLIVEAVRLIYQAKGSVKIKELAGKLFISQSPFEKRFRKLVGTSPKKFSSIVRFNTVLEGLSQAKSLTEISYENNFFDQAHFIKDFKQYTGNTPEQFKKSH